MKKKINNKMINKIRKWIIDQKIKNTKISPGLINQIIKIHKEATGKKLKGEEKKLMEIRVKRTSYFAKKMIITLCCLGVFVVSVSVMLKAGNLIDNAKNEKRKENYRWICVCSAIFVLIFALSTMAGFFTSDFGRDTKEITVIIEDKWHENGNYYFADKNGNIYKISYKWNSEYKYDNNPFKKYKDLTVGEKYTIDVLYLLQMQKYGCGKVINERKELE